MPPTRALTATRSAELGEVLAQPEPDRGVGAWCRSRPAARGRAGGRGPVVGTTDERRVRSCAPGAREEAGGGHRSFAVPAHHRERTVGQLGVAAIAPSSTWTAPGRWPAAYSLAWRTSSIVSIDVGRRRRGDAGRAAWPAAVQRVDASAELADELLVADRCGTGGRGRLRSWSSSRTNTSGGVGGRRASRASWRTRAQRDRRSSPGTWPAAKSAIGRTSTTQPPPCGAGAPRRRARSSAAAWGTGP